MFRNLLVSAAFLPLLSVVPITGGAAVLEAQSPKTGVLLVSHGSRSLQWRNMLMDLHDAVEQDILAHSDIDGVRSAFMEYNEPSIATQLRSFDDGGFEQIILIPLLLTVSSHSFDDIPTIYGAKESAQSRELLRAEGIERYTPRATVTMTPLLDYPSFLQQNILRRARSLSTSPSEEAVVIVAYGDETYEEEWRAVFDSVGSHITNETGIGPVSHAWCGHIVRYSTEPTKIAIANALQEKERVLVIPALVARDQMFQDRIIGGAVQEMEAGERIVYRPDSILPDPALNDWVVRVAKSTADQIARTR